MLSKLHGRRLYIRNQPFLFWSALSSDMSANRYGPRAQFANAKHDSPAASFSDLHQYSANYLSPPQGFSFSDCAGDFVPHWCSLWLVPLMNEAHWSWEQLVLPSIRRKLDALYAEVSSPGKTFLSWTGMLQAVRLESDNYGQSSREINVYSLHHLISFTLS